MDESDSKELLKSYKGFFEKFAEVHLKSYGELLVSNPQPPAQKVFNDPVWHSISLFPIEIILLDSPLLQRLRRIRQLGVAHLTYPGAGHSRFEHTIGVIHQVGQLVASINKSPECKNCIDETCTRLLRLAALCHDIGHGVMSHVAENAMDNDHECLSLKFAFADKLKLGETKISEIAAYYIVGSPSFNKILDYAKHLSGDSLPSNAPEDIQKIITGQSFFNKIPLLQEIVTGPFDADKLDYMTRDAFMAGVPVVVDVPRLVQKVRAVELSPLQLPKLVGEKVRGGLPSYDLIGIELSGGRTLDELMLARTLLFDKIYHHQKVRAAEAMISSILSCLTEVLGGLHASVPYQFSDEALIGLSEQTILQTLSRLLKEGELTKIKIACDLASRIRDRRLFVRCFALVSPMPEDAYRSNKDQEVRLERLTRALPKSEVRLSLEKEIVDEVEIILDKLGKKKMLNQIPGSHLYHYVRISAAQPPSKGNDIPRAYLIAGKQHIMPFKLDAAETRGWADGYILTRDMGYVFAPVEFSPYVYLATEKLLRTKYKIHIPRIILHYAKQNSENVDNIRAVLASKGYYATAPRDIWPMPGRLKMLDIEQRLNALVAKFAGYQGFNTKINQEATETISSIHITDWLRQFDEDDMIEIALDVIEGIQFIGRHQIVQVLQEIFDKHSEYNGAHLCLLGLPKDSSSVISYIAADITDKYGITAVNLNDALRSDRPIVFVDDFIGSGQQSVSILETWFGSSKIVELHEKRGSALSPQQQKSLRERQIAFIFTAGWNKGKEYLEFKAKELGLDILVSIGITENTLPTVFKVPIKKAKSREKFLRRCSDIGTELMKGTDYDATKSAERCLGYGNEANLVVFPYNTPSQTLTCIWASGNYRGSPWSPLFPRRKKT